MGQGDLRQFGKGQIADFEGESGYALKVIIVKQHRNAIFGGVDIRFDVSGTVL